MRIFGTPGTAGAYADLPNTKAGAIEAEKRAIAETLNRKEVERPTKATQKSEPAPTGKTIKEHAKTFQEMYKPDQKPSERRGKKQILDGHLLPFFGDMSIDQVKQTDVDAFAMKELARKCSVKTVNNRLAVLSSLIRYSTGEKPRLRLHLDGMLGELAALPMADVEKLLGAEGDERFRVVVLLAAEAGLRAGEIRGLQWGDIRNGMLTIRRSLDNATNEATPPKHNKSRTIPLSPRLLAALDALPRRGLWVVSRLDGDALGYYGLNEAIAALYERAKVTRPKKAIHCLRHTFGTEMAKQVPLPVLQRLMGHADVKTTLRYVDVDDDQKRDAIALVFGARGSNVAAGPKNQS